MIDRVLQKLEQEELADWGVILYGWKGIPGCSLKIKVDDIETFAMKKLDRLEGEILDIAIELTSAKFLEQGTITELLKNLCKLENIDTEISYRKWRLATLEEIMNNLSYDCIYDLIELTDFWVSWGNPKNKPHIIQGVDSNISPSKYYTEKNLDNLLKAHRAWIIEERKKINHKKN